MKSTRSDGFPGNPGSLPAADYYSVGTTQFRERTTVKALGLTENSLEYRGHRYDVNPKGHIRMFTSCYLCGLDVNPGAVTAPCSKARQPQPLEEQALLKEILKGIDEIKACLDRRPSRIPKFGPTSSRWGLRFLPPETKGKP